MERKYKAAMAAGLVGLLAGPIVAQAPAENPASAVDPLQTFPNLFTD